MEGITITMTTNKIEDFVSREEFIKRTGIFVTPEYFEYIYPPHDALADVRATLFAYKEIEALKEKKKG